jgi:hypothetical protein
MTMLTPVFYIDGKKTKLLRPIEGQKNVYFAPSAQARKFGQKVTEDALPNGINSRFSFGTADNEGIAATMNVADDNRNKRISDELIIEVAGKKMIAYVAVNDLGKFDDEGKKLYNLVVRVTTKPQSKTLSESEIYV